MSEPSTPSPTTPKPAAPKRTPTPPSAESAALLRRLLSWLVGGLALLALALQVFVLVPAGQVGVVFSGLSGVREQALREGISFKVPLLDRVTLYDARLQEVTLAGDQAINARSKEGLNITADVTVQYALERENASGLHQALGPNYTETFVRPQIRSKVRDAIGQLNAADLISTQRQVLEKDITEELTREFAQNNLVLQAVLLRELNIPESVARAIEEKQTAEQQVAVEQNRLRQAEISAQRAEVEAQGQAKAAVARAEGEARALALRGAALRENPQLIQLTVAEKLSPGIQTVLVPEGSNFLLDLQGEGASVGGAQAAQVLPDLTGGSTGSSTGTAPTPAQGSTP